MIIRLSGLLLPAAAGLCYIDIMNANIRRFSSAFCIATVLSSAIILSGCNSGQKYLDDGIGKLRDNEPEAAVKLLESAVKKMPENSSAHCNLGIAYLQLNQPEKALKSFNLAADLEETADPRLLEFIGRTYGELGRWKESCETLERAQQIIPSPRILNALAVANVNTGDLNRAIVYIQDALRQDPDYAPALYNIAIIEKDKLNHKENAAGYFEKYVQAAKPGDLHLETAKKFLAEGSPPPITQAPEPVITRREQQPKSTAPASPVRPTPEPAIIREQPKSSIDSLVVKAKSAIQNEEFDSALILLNDAVKKDPRDPDALWELARLYDKCLQSPEKAEQTYRKFAQLFPDDPRVKPTQKQPVLPDIQRTEAIKQPVPPVKRTEPVKQTAAVKSRSDPLAARQELALGLDCHNKGDLANAAAHYKKAFELDNTYASAAYNLGLAYKAQGKLNEAKDSFLRALALDPESADTGYMLGVVCKDMKDNNAAIEYLNAVLKKKPDYFKAHYVLGLIYRDLGNSASVKKHFESCIQLAPDTPYAEKAEKHLKDARAGL